MCKKYKLKGLLVGRIGCEIPPTCHQLMEQTDFMDYSKFITSFNKCKFILTCSEADASPRTVSEAMCFNLPVLMNKKILGGWQYVSEQTGEFFDPDTIDTEFEPVLDKFMKKLNNNEYTPREWFIKNYGKYNSGKRLFDFVKTLFKENELNVKYDEIDYMKPGI
jgi:UDP-N-acetylglucosamine 2-epimerase